MENAEKFKIISTDQGCLYLSQMESESDMYSVEEQNSIYRVYEDKEFPLGEVDNIQVYNNEKYDITEVVLKVGGKAVLLKSGEVYENNDGSLNIVPEGESILIFKNILDIEKVTFFSYNN